MSKIFVVVNNHLVPVQLFSVWISSTYTWAGNDGHFVVDSVSWQVYIVWTHSWCHHRNLSGSMCRIPLLHCRFFLDCFDSCFVISNWTGWFGRCNWWRFVFIRALDLKKCRRTNLHFDVFYWWRFDTAMWSSSGKICNADP